MKKINIYNIEDDLVKRALSDFGNSLKYICKTNKRKKDDIHAIWYYQSYIASYFLLQNKKLEDLNNITATWTPSEFYKAMIDSDISFVEDEIVIEFLQIVARYMKDKTGEEHTITFIPFYFEQSFENKFNAIDKFGKYVKEYLMGKLGYTAKELREYTMSVSSIIEEYWFYDEVKIKSHPKLSKKF